MKIIIVAILLTITLSSDIECFKSYVFDKDDAKACDVYRQMLYNGLSESKGIQQINKILNEANYKKNPFFWQAYIPINIHELAIVILIAFQTFGRKILYKYKSKLDKKQHSSQMCQLIFVQLETCLTLEIWEHLGEEKNIQYTGKFMLLIKTIISLIWLATSTFRIVNNCTWRERIGIIAYFVFVAYSLFGFFQQYRQITPKLYVLYPLCLLFICTQNYFMFAIFQIFGIVVWPLLMYKTYDQYIAPLPSSTILLSYLANMVLVFTKMQPKKSLYKIKIYLQKRLQVRKNEKTFRYCLEIMQKSSQDTECSICLQMMKLEEKTYDLEFIDHVKDWQIIKTPCNHFYHKICLSKWLKESSKCPIDFNMLQLKNE